jgi:hypothetical protein
MLAATAINGAGAFGTRCSHAMSRAITEMPTASVASEA